MTRAMGARPAGSEFEIELTRPDGAPVAGGRAGDGAGDGTDDPRPTNWRRVIAVASIAGVVLGIGVGVLVVRSSGDDQESSGADSTLDPDSLATSITTPPTLSPLTDLPAVDLDPGALPEAPSATSSQSWSLFDQVTMPVFEPYEGEPPDGGFDLDAAVANLADGRARRSMTHLELGVEGFVRDYTIEHDAVRNRYRIGVTDTAGSSSSVMLDESIDALLWDASVDDADERWVSVDASDEAAGFGVERLGVLFDRLLAGPVRGETITTAEVTPGELVLLGDASPARAYEVVVDGAAIPEWQIYALGPTQEFLPSDRPTRLTYAVYVDAANEIRHVVGVSDPGGLPQLIEHELELLPDPVVIELPAAATIVTEPPRSG